MPQTRLYILPMAHIENDLAWNVAAARVGSVDNPHPPAEWVSVPCFAYLIEHPSAGRVLLDVGPHPDDKERLPADVRRYFPWMGGPGDTLEARLAELGLKPADIDLVIVSHMHWDHCGGLYLFANEAAGKQIMVGRRDFEYGLLSTHKEAGQPFGGGGYFKENFEIPGLSFEPIDPEMGDYSLAPGLQLIQLGGHTPQVLGLMLHLEHTGTVILPSDAIYMSRNFGPPPVAPGIVYDSLGFFQSVQKVRQMQKATSAWIIYPHDPEQERQLKLAPAYYD